MHPHLVQSCQSVNGSCWHEADALKNHQTRLRREEDIVLVKLNGSTH